MTQKKILLLAGTKLSVSKKIDPLINEMNRLFPHSDLRFKASALSQLGFWVSNTEASIRDPEGNFDIADFDLVVFRIIGDYKEEAMAAAIYLTNKNKKFIDSEYPRTFGKLGSIMRHWDAGLSVPDTIYGPNDFLMNELGSRIGLPAVAKSINGRKGRDNYLVRSTSDLADVLVDANHNINFMVQKYIPNNGDYRVLVMDGRDAVVSLREGDGSTHLNNVSAGGTEKLVGIDDIMPEVKLARQAAKKEGLQVAGVDIITDKNTGQPYILEVNRAPQLTIDEEVSSFYQLMDKITKSRRILNRPVEVIGRRVNTRIPELHIKNIVGKIDTGAFSSSLHAENIRVENGILRFNIVPSEYIVTKSGNTEQCEATAFEIKKVRSSTGHLEKRYSINIKMSIRKRICSAEVMLSNRSLLGYPLLIGRQSIRSRFLVNVELDEHNRKIWKY